MSTRSVPLPVAVARNRRGALTGPVHLIAAGVLLGTGGLLGSLLRQATGLSPMAVAAYRLAAGGALLVVVLAATGRRLPRTAAAWTRIGGVGVLAAVYQACYFASIALTSVSLATLVAIGAFPVLVLMLERLTGRRRVDRRMVATVALALAGLCLLVGVPRGDHPVAVVLGSAALAVGAASGFAAVTVLGARPVAGLDDLATTGYGFLVGGLLLVPLAGLTVGLGFHPAPRPAWLLAALAVGPTAAAYTLYFRGLRTVAPSTAAVITLLEPLTGAVLAAVLLGDRLGPTGVAGAALLAVAVVLAAGASREIPRGND